MNSLEIMPLESEPRREENGPKTNSMSLPSGPDDPRVIKALEEYLAALETGHQPDRQEFLARHAAIAPVLAGCLDGLVFMQTANPGRQPVADDRPVESRGKATPLHAIAPLGDFCLLREVGRGGMGIVYEAEQLSLGRRVALKVLPFAAALDPKQLQRFKNEAQAAAHLHHTNIVPVYGIGCERGVHFYAMQFIEGQTLAAIIQELRQNDQGPMTNDQRMTNDQCQKRNDLVPGVEAQTSIRHSTLGILWSLGIGHSSFFRTVASLGVQAAEALEHAHQLGVIHRDIKPGNLLEDVRGNLWITDFGLAHCQSQAVLTLSGDLIGTLRYMSPEQALAKRSAVDGRTDIYSLGVTLYELLTLEPAFPGQDREEVLRRIAFEEPRPPRRSNRAVPAELETIVLKAMAKTVDERYATAQELADDLRRFLEDKPIRAKRPSLRHRAVKWARRHKTMVRGAVVIMVLAIVGLVISTALIWQAKEGLRTVLERERRASYFQSIALAEREWFANDLTRVEQLLDACLADLRDWEWRYLKRLRLEGLPELRHSRALFSAVFSPDGRWIACGSQDGKVMVWDSTTGQRLCAFPAHQRHVEGVSFSPDGRQLATAGWDGTVKIWDFDHLRAADIHSLIRSLPGHADGVESVAFSPDGQHLASAGRDKTVRIWDVATGNQLWSGGHTGIVNCVVYSPDGQSLASASEDKSIKIWDASAGRERLTVSGRTAVWSVAFSPDGRWLVSASKDPTSNGDCKLTIWDAQTGSEILAFRDHVMGLNSVAFSPDGHRVASAGFDGNVKLWDLASGREAIVLRGHEGGVCSVAFSRDGNRIVSASFDCTVRVWNATPLEGEARPEAGNLLGHEGGVRSVAFSPDGHHLVSAGDDSTVRVWDFDAELGKDSRHAIHVLPGHKSEVSSLAFSKDGRLLASGGEGGLTVWDATTWKRRYTLPETGSPVAFSPDGRYLVAAGGQKGTDFLVKVREAETGRELQPLKGHDWSITALLFRPDPAFTHLASASWDGTVRIWDLTASREIREIHAMRQLLGPSGGLRCLSFSSDGRFLASAGMARIVKVWDARSWTLFQDQPGLTGCVHSVAFHPQDSRVLAFGSTDGTVKVWDITTREMIRILRGHTSTIESVAFSPDGKWIASASNDGTVKIWKAPPLPDSSGRDTK